MALRDQPARAAHRDDEGQWWAAPVVVIPVLALIANVGAYALAVHGAAFVVRFDIIGGFSYGMPSLFPILEALILAFGLWWCTPLSPGRAVVAAVILLVFRIAVTFAVVYVLSLTTPKMSDAFLTSPLAAYVPRVISTAFSGASLLLILAIYDRSFRSWWAWILTLLIWAGGTALLFWLYRSEILLASYPWVTQCVRALGFVVIGCQFQQSLRRQH